MVSVLLTSSKIYVYLCGERWSRTQHVYPIKALLFDLVIYERFSTQNSSEYSTLVTEKLSIFSVASQDDLSSSPRLTWPKLLLEMIVYICPIKP
jgi:hypothetical protein